LVLFEATRSIDSIFENRINSDHLAAPLHCTERSPIHLARAVAPAVCWEAMLARTVLLPLLLLPALAAAQPSQPVETKLQNDVAAGKKPTLTVIARRRVVEVQLSLAREGGGEAGGKVAALSPGQSHVFPIGDGQAGRAHWTGKLDLVVSGQGPATFDLSFDTVVRAPLHVGYRKDHLDLDKRLLEFQLNRPAKHAALEVIGEDGATLGEGAADYHGEAPGTWLPIRWTQPAGKVLKLELSVTDADGQGVKAELVPWSVTIPHEEVNFATASAVIEPGERPKLDAALSKINEALARAGGRIRVSLFIAGHTDTVGSRESNRRLSIERARSISLYFRGKGLRVPISYEGFGEDALKVKTPDETDERQNRRADYVLSAEQPDERAPAQWKSVQ
jgi:outer membrane protein OmpA-like peptidoglycan-associated protein